MFFKKPRGKWRRGGEMSYQSFKRKCKWREHRPGWDWGEHGKNYCRLSLNGARCGGEKNCPEYAKRKSRT